MIVFDINVVSEPMKPNPDRRVMQWLDSQDRSSLYFTATSLAELLLGIGKLPIGRRKTVLETSLAAFVNQLFDNRILPFDEPAARAYAALTSHARDRGMTISMADGQIAAIASVHGFTVATRDVRPFAAAGVPVINPWQAED